MLGRLRTCTFRQGSGQHLVKICALQRLLDQHHSLPPRMQCVQAGNLQWHQSRRPTRVFSKGMGMGS